MHRGSQFSIATLLLVTLAVAIGLQFGRFWPVALGIALVAAIAFASELLIRTLPKSIATLYTYNCTRADGSRSLNREKIEREQFRLFRSNIRLLVLIAFAPWIVFVGYEYFSGDEILITSIILLFTSFAIVRSGYLYFLKQHIFRMNIRSQNFKLRDLHLHLREMEKSKNDKSLPQAGEETAALAAGSLEPFAPRPQRPQRPHSARPDRNA